MRWLYWLWGLWVACAVVGVGWFLLRPAPAVSRTRLIGVPATVQISVDAAGAFNPSTVNIETGDGIQWTGMGLRDRVARIADAGAEPCDALAVYGSVVDEFTGPKVIGHSGIFVRGPTNTAGGPEIVALPTACDNDLDPICPDCPAGGALQYCENQTGAPMVIPSEVVLYEEVDGGLIILEWDEFETADQTFVTTQLDLELEQFSNKGKDISIGIKGGQGSIPAWLFPAGGGTVTPVPLEGNNNNDFSPDYTDCGTDWNAGSFADGDYVVQIEEMISFLAEHIKADTKWRLALDSIVMMGFNATTDEFKTNVTCPDEFTGAGTTGGPDGKLDSYGGDDCKCNTQAWANAGYTEEGLYDFVVDQVKFIHEKFWDELVVRYLLIQGGLPSVESPTNFLGDTLQSLAGTPLCPTCTSSDDASLPTSGGQVNGIIDAAFTLVPDVHAFQPQHAGLGCFPTEEEFCDNTACAAACSYMGTPDLITDPARCVFPLPLVGPITTSECGCPNRWANTVSMESPTPRLTGFQTNNRTNGVASLDALESAFWNMTCNTNATMFETYAENIFEVHETTGEDGDMNPTRDDVADPITDPAIAETKSIEDWADELHTRRENPFFSSRYGDDRPTIYSFRFTQNDTHRYTNPRTCADGTGTLGTINVGGVSQDPPAGTFTEEVVSDGFTRQYLRRGDPALAVDVVVWLHGGHNGGDVTVDATTHMARITPRDFVIDVTPQAYPGTSGWYQQNPPGPDYPAQTLAPGWSGNEDTQFLGVDLITDLQAIYPLVERFYLVAHSHGGAFVFSAISNGWPGGVTPYSGYGVHKNTLWGDDIVAGEWVRQHTAPFAMYIALNDPVVEAGSLETATYPEMKAAMIAEFGAVQSSSFSEDCCNRPVETFFYGVTPFRWHEENSGAHSWVHCTDCSVDEYMVQFFIDHADLGD